MLRVLSDLHFAHPASLLQRVSQIEPLLEGVGKVVFNGDTVELRAKASRPRSEGHLKQIEALCRDRGIEPHFINGNHDPDASALNHYALMGGRLLITHGHVFFPEITPWGREAGRYKMLYALALKGLSIKGRIGLEEHLRAVRKACSEIPPGEGRSPETAGRWVMAAFSELSHPLRAWEVLRAWSTCPGLVSAFAREICPQVQGVIMGHTHLPGCWMREGRLVINTGSYLPWLGRRLVDVSGTSLVVRAVERDGTIFRPGKEIFRWSPETETIGVKEPGLILPARKR